jgi:hypothetical protein
MTGEKGDRSDRFNEMIAMDLSDDWSEEEYVAYLGHERHLYAWCLMTYGHMTQRDANEAALSFYDYEPENAPYRGLIFHCEAWHWAMLRIFGETYWKARPDLEKPSQDYLTHAVEFESIGHD